MKRNEDKDLPVQLEKSEIFHLYEILGKVKKNKLEYGGKQMLLCQNPKKSLRSDKGKGKGNENAIEINFELLGRDSRISDRFLKKKVHFFRKC